MIPDQELIQLNKEGFIPGPLENEENYLKRVEFSKKLVADPKNFLITQNKKAPFSLDEKVLKPRWNWTRSQLMSLFGISQVDLPMYYSNENLTFLQPAATWILSFDNINLPILQFRKVLNKKSYLGIYTLDEILAHEAVHAARVAFDEPHTEEIFSYMTASSSFRRVFGPIIRSTKEIIIFFSLLFFTLFIQMIWILSSDIIFFYLSSILGLCTISYVTIGLIRLFNIRRKMKKTLKKLISILGNDKKKAKAVIFRLTDEEIFKFSKMQKEDIANYIQINSKTSLRLKTILLSYF